MNTVVGGTVGRVTGTVGAGTVVGAGCGATGGDEPRVGPDAGAGADVGGGANGRRGPGRAALRGDAPAEPIKGVVPPEVGALTDRAAARLPGRDTGRPCRST